MFEKRRKEIAKRRAEIRAMLAGTDEVDMDALESETSCCNIPVFWVN